MANVSFNINAVDKTRAAFYNIQRNLAQVRASTQAMTAGMSRAGMAFLGMSSVAGVASQTLRKVREDVEAIPGIPDHVRESVHMFNQSLQEAQVSVSGLVARGIAGFQSFGQWIGLMAGQLVYGKEAADAAKKELEGVAKAARAAAQAKKEGGVQDLSGLRRSEQAALEALAKTQREAFQGTEDLDSALIRVRATYDGLADSVLRAKGETPEAITARTNAYKGMTDALREEVRLIDQITDRAREAQRRFDEFGGRMAASFENAVFSGGKLKDMLRDIANDLIRLVFQESITKPLAGWISGGLQNIFRAQGGSVAGGESYIVGERGPELFTPSQAGRVIPNHAISASGGGAVVINYHNSFSSGLQAAQILPMLEQTKQATIAAIQDLRARRKIA